jgi:hypothetical protein
MERRQVVVQLQKSESDPATSEQVAMFERAAWTHDRRLAHIMERAKAASIAPAAE